MRKMRKTAMEKTFDTFDFEIRRINYENSYTSGDGRLRCIFMINGKDLYEIIKEALNDKGAYHHTTPVDLWAFDLDDDPYKLGRIHPLICSCDELGCDNISVRVTENDESISWNDFYREAGTDDEDDEESANIEYLKLSFQFEKNDYKRKIEELKKISRALCSR